MTRTTGFVLLAVGAVISLIGVIGTINALTNLGQGAVVILPFVVVDLIGACVLVYAIRGLLRSQPNVLSQSKAADSYIPNVGVEHELDNTPYTVHYTPPTKGKNAKPSVLTISTAVPCDYEFQLVVKTWFDKLGRWLRIAVNVETGDKQFDDECYARSETPAFAAAYLTDPVKRIAILDLRRLGFREVTLNNGKLSATWTGFNPTSDHRDDLAPEVAARLLLLARDLPASQPEFADRPTSQRRFWQVVLWALLVCFALTALSLIAFPPIEFGDLLLYALPVVALLWPVFAFVSAWLLSGTSRSHLAWGGLLLGSLFLVPIGSAGIVTTIDGVFDASPATAHDAMIVDKYTTRSKNTTHYHVRVVSWRNPVETISFDVSSNEYDAVVPGRSKLIVTTHAGALGIEWRQSKRLEK